MAAPTHTDVHQVYDLPGGNKIAISEIRITSSDTDAAAINITPLEKVIDWCLAFDTSNGVAAVAITTSGYVATSGALNTVWLKVAADATNAKVKIISFGV